jgi:type III restriction enzyme
MTPRTATRSAYLQKICPELQDAVLVIHTKVNGEISEAASGKNKDELEVLRKQSNEIDTWQSPFKAIVSVLMLKEGWDVRNVTTVVGLRAFAAKSNILPEQTLGRGLRRMYFGSDARETVSVMGTPAFMDFVESIQSEGVTFERVPMGGAGGSGTAGFPGRRGRQGRHRQGHRCAGYRAATAHAPLQS